MTERNARRQQRRKSISAGLRSHRAAERVSQKDFAESIEANPATVSNWENCGSVSTEDAWEIADHYGITLDELVGRTVPNPREAVA